MASFCGDLPEDVFSDEILPRLPILSLFRLRCVSKSWSLITRRIILGSLFPSEGGPVDFSELIVQVVDKTLHRNGICYWKRILSLSYDNLDLGFTLTPHITLTDEILRLHDVDYRFVGSVNGIVVVHSKYSFASGFHMWNPATNSCKRATKCITPYLHESNYHDPWVFVCTPEHEYLGCGFCSQSEDIKVVTIRSYSYWLYPSNMDVSESDENEFSDANDTFTDEDTLDEIKEFLDTSDDFVNSFSDSEGNDDVSEIIDPVRDLNLQPDYMVEVYSLSTDSCRQVDVDAQFFLQFPPCSSKFYPQQGYANNTFSWLVITHGIGHSLIVKLLTFHMITEVFQVTSVPDYVLGDFTNYSIFAYDTPGNPRRVPIQLMNGTIALAIPTHDQSFEIWLLLEYGAMDSWTRLCTIGPFPEVHQILGYWKNGKLFLESTSGELLLADLITNKIIQNLQIEGTEGTPGNTRIIAHKETHFLLKGSP